MKLSKKTLSKSTKDLSPVSPFSRHCWSVLTKRACYPHVFLQHIALGAHARAPRLPSMQGMMSGRASTSLLSSSSSTGSWRPRPHKVSAIAMVVCSCFAVAMLSQRFEVCCLTITLLKKHTHECHSGASAQRYFSLTKRSDACLFFGVTHTEGGFGGTCGITMVVVVVVLPSAR